MASPGFYVTSVQLRADRPPAIPPGAAPGKRPAPAAPEEQLAEVKARKRLKKKEKRDASKQNPREDEQERWQHLEGAVTELPAELQPPPPPAPTWPEAFAESGAELHSALAAQATGIAGAAAVLRALRASLALDVQDPAWLQYLEQRLTSSLQAVCTDPSNEDFTADAATFRAADRLIRKRGKKPQLPPALRLLPRLAALDTLHFALWALSHRRGQPEPEPTVLACDLERALLADAERAAALRRALKPLTVRRLLRPWGLRLAWANDESDAGSPWEQESCPLLKLLRSRWTEAACAVLRGQPSASDARVRAALLQWQFAGRDIGARWFAFAVPNAEAMSALAETGDKKGVVELGAGNGHWARLLASKGVKVFPLDVDPPSGVPGLDQQPAVVQGAAESLRQAKQQTLLLCMPPPSEEACSDQAVEEFRGRHIAYVGEWATGMTATKSFHWRLLKDFMLEKRVALPCWPKTRVELFIFRRRKAEEAEVRQPSPSSCDGCGSFSQLRRCPWTRQLCICSEECWEAVQKKHNALISVCFCTAKAAERPPYTEWEECRFLHADFGETKRWEALREATPQERLRL